MTTLVQVLEQLSLAELSNIHMGNSGTGVILEEHVPKVVLHINDGLLRMFTRMVLSQRDVLIEQHDHITNYHLLSRFAVFANNGSLEPYLYIRDLPEEKFKDDVIKILKVFDSNGVELPLNDDKKENSVFTPQNNVLQIPAPKTGMCVSVLYQAKHPTLSPDNLEQVVQLPDGLFECLRAYVAHKVFSAIATQEAQAKAQEHFAYFNALIDETTISDSSNTSISTTNSKFSERGWI